MKSKLVLTYLLWSSIFVTVLAGCNSGSSGPPPNITVSISAATSQVEAGGTWRSPGVQSATQQTKV